MLHVMKDSFEDHVVNLGDDDFIEDEEQETFSRKEVNFMSTEEREAQKQKENEEKREHLIKEEMAAFKCGYSEAMLKVSKDHPELFEDAFEG